MHVQIFFFACNRARFFPNIHYVGADENRLQELMLAGLAGDSSSYHALLRELSGLLRGFFRKRLQTLPDEVEDLVQETLLALHNQRHTWESGELLMPWVYAIARYKLVDLLRRRNTHESLNDPFDEDEDFPVCGGQEALDARRDVAKLLDQLPERQRLPIQYVKLDGLSVVEAASITGMSESAIKTGVHRGLKALAAKIRGDK